MLLVCTYKQMFIGFKYAGNLVKTGLNFMMCVVLGRAVNYVCNVCVVKMMILQLAFVIKKSDVMKYWLLRYRVTTVVIMK